MRYQIFKLSQRSEINSYLAKLQSDQKDIYHYPDYQEIYEQNGDGKVTYFVYESQERLAIYPFLKNNINSLGYDLSADFYDIQGVYGYNGVITNSPTHLDFQKDFHKAFESYCKDNRIVAEFTRFHPVLKNYYFSRDYLEIIPNRETVFLDLSLDKEVIWRSCYSSKNRNMIRKAIKNKLMVYESKEFLDYEVFFQLYTKTMNKVKAEKYMFFNIEYFKNFRHLLSDHSTLILAKLGNEVIGGMILLFTEKFAHYHLSARKSEYGKYAVNNYMLDFAIDIAKEKKCSLFHLGGGTSGNEDDSLLRFKTNFSKEKLLFKIGKKIHDKETYSIISEQWKEKFPFSYRHNRNLILGYRMIHHE